MSAPLQLGVVGLGVMGHNLALNLAEHGAEVIAFDQQQASRERMASAAQSLTGDATLRVVGSLRELVAALQPPRQLLLMVPAGAPVDALIAELTPLLSHGDALIDGGNSHPDETERRWRELSAQGFELLGMGVSGGSEGARFGPALMPGGSTVAYERLAPLLNAIAAKHQGDPCCAFMGSGGAGHFVKMVHNGIEYGDMQLIAEAYALMKDGLGLDNLAMQRVFARWNEGVLDAYLIEITRDILGNRDAAGGFIVDQILDRAGQKGTGRWTAEAALAAGQPLTLVTEAVFARALSSMKSTRVRSSTLAGPDLAALRADLDPDAFIADLEQALYAAKIVSYTQGYLLLRAASEERGWGIDLAATARTWRGGCIIRSRFLGDIATAFEADGELEHLLMVPFFAEALKQAHLSWRRVVASGVQLGIALPALSAALAFYDGLRTAEGPANLLQAQRDYFGSHTFVRRDDPEERAVHHPWVASRP
jgi:6-phosphogluconate dehydrogenase